MLFQHFSALAGLLVSTASAGFVSYLPPSRDLYPKSPHFSLRVNGTYMETVNYDLYDYVQLSMDEGHDTEFNIKATDQKEITSWSITPANLGIKAHVADNQLIFTVKKAHYLIVKINKAKEFVILADPTEKDVPKSKGTGIFNVLDYKADNTGKAITKGVQAAMDAAAKTPGSIVFVPPGLYVIGNLMLRDKTSLYLAGGAVLRFSDNPADYKTMYTKKDLFPGTWWIQTEINSTDIKIYGRGTIDGNGHAIREKKFMASLLVPVGTSKFRADGIVVRDSSFWAVMPVQSDHVYIVNLKILNRFDVTQDDGVDVCESTTVTVRRTLAIANDDSFSAKTWSYNEGTTVPYPFKPRANKDVLFDDCLAWTRCYAYKIGEGVWERQDNVKFQNSVVYYAGVGIGIHHKFGTATANNITFEDIDIERLGGSPGGQAAWLTVYVHDVNQGVGPVEQVTVKNIRARMQGGKPGLLQGVSDSAMVTGVTLTDIYMYNNKSAAKTLKDMNLLGIDFSKDIHIRNT